MNSESITPAVSASPTAGSCRGAAHGGAPAFPVGNRLDVDAAISGEAALRLSDPDLVAHVPIPCEPLTASAPIGRTRP